MLRAIRGATTAPSNCEEEILAVGQELLRALLAENEMGADHLVCAFFSATPDLDAAFPARAARQIGWTDVPLFGAQELVVLGAPERCLRVMLLADVPAGASPVRHVYLRGARTLRPDLAASGVRQATGAAAGAIGEDGALAVASGGLASMPAVSSASFFGFYFYRR